MVEADGQSIVYIIIMVGCLTFLIRYSMDHHIKSEKQRKTFLRVMLILLCGWIVLSLLFFVGEHMM